MSKALNTPIITPKITIILPVYNGGAYLQESLDSIFAQTFKNYELLIINDGSIDNTKEILKRITDKRVKLFDNGTNKGIAYGLNVGMRNATGEYITWTSHDNKFRPKALEKMCDYLNQNININLVTAGYRCFGKATALYPGKEYTLDTMILNFIGNACFMYRKSVINKIGYYDEDLKGVCDWDYWIRILELFPYKSGTIKEVLYDFRLHNAQTTEKYIRENKFYIYGNILLSKLLQRNKHGINFKLPVYASIINNHTMPSIKKILGDYIK